MLIKIEQTRFAPQIRTEGGPDISRPCEEKISISDMKFCSDLTFKPVEVIASVQVFNPNDCEFAVSVRKSEKSGSILG